MGRFRLFLIWTLAVLMVWAVFTWPLPLHVLDGVPSSSENVEKNHVRRMIPGDHLQILYQFWLVNDMITGHTPWFHDLYQFNTGRDSEQREKSAYFMPFPLFFMLGAWVSPAFASNLVVLLSLLLSYIFTCMLVRRYTGDYLSAGVLALLSIAFPFRWITLLGGSPTGLAMMWPPLLFLGIDMAVREDRIWGGFLAGVTLLLTFCSDLHMVFFGVLAIPPWCILAFAARPHFEWRRLRSYGRTLLALLPLMVLAIGVVYLVQMVKSGLADSSMQHGRHSTEISLFAPRLQGLYAWNATGISRHAYFGFVTAAVLAIGWLVMTVKCFFDRKRYLRDWVVLSLFVAGVTGIVMLALGPYGPFEGRMLLGVRKIISPYRMIRQTVKIYCLLPVLLSVAGGLAFHALAPASSHKAWRILLGAVLAVLMIAEYRVQIEPTVCLLAKEQGAYANVLIDSELDEQPARAMAVTLWPGDTHWSSLYQYYASLYRIRMVNGYKPAVSQAYIKYVFSYLDSVNMGELTVGQMQAMLDRGIRYILLHEDAFPEKVSAYPIGFTLQRLLLNPRLEMIAQDEAVWAFKILDKPAPRAEVTTPWKTYFPSRVYEAEKCHGENCPTGQDDKANGRWFVTLAEEGSSLSTRLTSTVPAPNQRWMIRVRGRGTLLSETFLNGESIGKARMRVNSSEWTWREIALPDLPGYTPIYLTLGQHAGSVDVDVILLAAGEWDDGESVWTLPAPAFFHAGYTDLEEDSVVLRAMDDPHGAIFYGPRMPMSAGHYQVEMNFSSDAPAGTALGELTVHHGNAVTEPVPVVAGTPAKGEFVQKDSLLVLAGFDFFRNDDIRIKELIFTRME